MLLLLKCILLDTPEAKYSKLLTAYSSAFVIKQLSLIGKVKQIQENGDVFTVETNDGLKVVSTSDYECVFRQSMKLPCCHLLALRKELKQPLYDAECCDKRWTTSYYCQIQRLFSGLPAAPSVTVFQQDSRKERKLSQQEKFQLSSVKLHVVTFIEDWMF